MSAARACTQGGDTWDSSSNYCRMPTSLADPKLFAFACPPGNEWNGSYCALERLQFVQMLANALQACTSLLRR